MHEFRLDSDRRRFATGATTNDLVWQDKPASKRYLTLDPDPIADELRRINGGNWVVETFRINPWQKALTVRERHGEDYQVGIRGLFDHQGRSSVRWSLGATRVFCQNQFYSPFHRFRHDSEEAGDFGADPATYVDWLLHLSSAMPRRIEALKGTQRDLYHHATILLREVAPKLCNKLVWNRRQFYPQDLNMWGFVQACTQSRNVTLGELAGNLLTEENHNALMYGRMPVQAFDKLLVRHTRPLRKAAKSIQKVTV